MVCSLPSSSVWRYVRAPFQSSPSPMTGSTPLVRIPPTFPLKPNCQSAHALDALDQHRPFQFRTEIMVALFANASQRQVGPKPAEVLRNDVFRGHTGGQFAPAIDTVGHSSETRIDLEGAFAHRVGVAAGYTRRMTEDRLEIRAVKVAASYYERLGWTVTNVSHVRGDHAGYDLLLEKGDERLMVEVKGCSRPFQIPDLYESEINPKTMQLVADEICVVYVIPGEPEVQMARIPREGIAPEFIKQKIGYRISGRFKNKRMMERFLVKEVGEGL